MLSGRPSLEKMRVGGVRADMISCSYRVKGVAQAPHAILQEVGLYCELALRQSLHHSFVEAVAELGSLEYLKLRQVLDRDVLLVAARRRRR